MSGLFRFSLPEGTKTRLLEQILTLPSTGASRSSSSSWAFRLDLPPAKVAGGFAFGGGFFSSGFLLTIGNAFFGKFSKWTGLITKIGVSRLMFAVLCLTWRCHGPLQPAVPCLT